MSMICLACGRQHAGECDKMALLRNELNYQKQARNGETATAALEWAIAEIERLRKGIQAIIDGDYEPRIKKMDRCPHGLYGYENCDACVDAALARLLEPTA